MAKTIFEPPMPEITLDALAGSEGNSVALWTEGYGGEMPVSLRDNHIQNAIFIGFTDDGRAEFETRPGMGMPAYRWYAWKSEAEWVAGYPRALGVDRGPSRIRVAAR